MLYALFNTHNGFGRPEMASCLRFVTLIAKYERAKLEQKIHCNRADVINLTKLKI